MRILFVCGMNKKRSPTAEAIYRNDNRFQVRSAGVSSSSKNRLTLKNIEWADLILVMEKKYKDRIVQNYRDRLELPRIQSLEISDEYEFMDAELVDLIKISVETLLRQMCIK